MRPLIKVLRSTQPLISRTALRQRSGPIMAEAKEPYILKMPITSAAVPAAKDSSKAKREWLVILPDHEGVLEKRISVRNTHLKEIKPKVEDGSCVLGGALLSSHPQENESPAMTGSAMLAVAESAEEVLETLKQDVYCTSGVWDMERVQIFPFKSAIRKEL